MPIEPVAKVWMDGELVDWDRARVHVLSHALHYGTGVFEGIRAYETRRGPAVYRLTDHIRRLFRSAQIYAMPIPYTIEELIEACKATVRANDLPSCYIRPLAFLGYGEVGLNPIDAPVTASVAVWRWGTYLGDENLERGVRAKISSWKRHDPNIMPPAAKATGQYVNSSAAKAEVVRAGYDEAIMLNGIGNVTDGSGENVFIVRDDVVLTPPPSAGILEGITRASVMRIARDQGFQVREVDLVRSDLYTADEAFFTGTAAEVCPIREIDDRRVGGGGRGPVTKKLQETFFAATRGEVPEYAGWLEPVE